MQRIEPAESDMSPLSDVAPETPVWDEASGEAIRKSLDLPDQESEPLAHAPPETLELVAESA